MSPTARIRRMRPIRADATRTAQAKRAAIERRRRRREALAKRTI